MNRKLFALTLSLLVTPTFPVVAGPVFIPLGGLPGGAGLNITTAISPDGSTVVGAASSSRGVEAYRWTFGGGMVGIGPAPGGSFLPLDLTPDGAVLAGRTEFRMHGGGHFEAFLWTEQSGHSTLGVLPGGGRGGVATGISADGTVVVGVSDSAAGTQAFRWAAETGMTELGRLPGRRFHTQANGVSADGSVIVGGSVYGEGEAFRWTAETGIVGLGFLANNHTYSTASAVSSDGRTIVGTSSLTQFLEPSAFRWTEETGIVSLGAFTALALADDAEVVVGASLNRGRRRAVIWDEVNGERELQTLLETDLGLDLAGWTLIEAVGVSDDGLVIVGNGRNPSGQFEGFVAVVPEPATLALLALGSWMIFPKKRDG